MSDASGDPGLPTPPPPPPDMAPPPGYVAYGGRQQGAFGTFRRVGGLGRTMGVLLTVLIPLQVISTVILASIRSKARDYLDNNISEDDFRNSTALSGLVSIVSGLIVLAVVVLTMIWMFRLAKNLRSIDRVATWGPGWGIAGWFLPPCGLYVIPYLMFRDLWKGSDPDSQHDWRSNPIGPVVHVWWILYGLAPIAFLGVTFASVNPNRSVEDLAKDLDDTFAIQILSGVVQIGAAIAYLLLVRQLTARHTQLTNEG